MQHGNREQALALCQTDRAPPDRAGEAPALRAVHSLYYGVVPVTVVTFSLGNLFVPAGGVVIEIEPEWPRLTRFDGRFSEVLSGAVALSCDLLGSTRLRFKSLRIIALELSLHLDAGNVRRAIVL